MTQQASKKSLKKMNKNKKLLKEFVFSVVAKETPVVLNEGMNLYQIWVQPFADVLDTAKHGIAKVVAKTGSEIKTLSKQFVMALMPYVPGVFDAKSMSKIRKEDEDRLKQTMDQIDSKYGDAINRNWDALVNSDLWGLFFLANPQAALTQRFATALAPSVAFDLLYAVSGGSPKVTEWKGWFDRVTTGGQKKSVELPAADPYSGGYGAYGNFDDGGGLYEQQQPQTAPQAPAKQPDPKTVIKKLLQDPEVKAAIENSPMTKAMRQAAVNSIVSNTQQLLNFDFNTVKQKAGQNFEKLVADIKKQMPDFNPDDQKLQQEVVKGMKDEIKQKAFLQLDSLVSSEPSLAQTIQKAKDTISKLP